MKKGFICILLLVFSAGCSSWPPYEAAAYIASIKKPNYKESDDAYNMLAAVAYHDTAMVRKLLKKGVDADIPLSPEGMTALMIAAESGHTDIVKLLLENKADVNAINANGGTALSIAVGVRLMNIKNMDSIKLLIKAGANVNSQDKSGTAPLHSAISNRDREVVMMLLDRDANVNAVTSEGKTPLHFLANPQKLPKETPWDDIEIAELLLQRGANPNVRARDGVWPKYENITPLSLAYELDNRKLVDLLLNHGADVNVGVRKEISLFHLAVKKNDVEMVKTLISRHTDITVKQQKYYDTPFDYGVRYGSIEIMELLITNYPEMVNARNEKGGLSPLEIAADSGRLEILKMLLEHGADLSAKGEAGRTPLHFATNGEIADFLISKGLDVNARRTDTRDTPLISAARRRNADVVRCLISHGADVNVRNKESYALHMVAMNWNREIAEMLLANGADINTKDYRGRTFAAIVRERINAKSEPQKNLQEMLAFLDDLEKNPPARPPLTP